MSDDKTVDSASTAPRDLSSAADDDLEASLEDHLSTDEVESLNALAKTVNSSEEDDLPSSGLLSFYDRLRSRVLSFVEEKGGSLAPKIADVLLLVPDTFMLLVRLALDKNVPKSTRVLIGSAIAYFVVPIDLLPEAFTGPVGYTDDMVLSMAVLAKAFGKDLEPIASKYWSGSQPLRTFLGDTLNTAHEFLDTDLYEKLQVALQKRGVDLEKLRD